jgi:hypothetical protein
MADDDAVSVADLLGELTTEALPAGDAPLSAFMMIKSRDAAGDAVWAVREAGESVPAEEMLGALTAYTEYLRRDLASDWAD